mgnify:CR=1 FL=1
MGADAAGAIPHFEFTREYSVESLNICFDLAQKYNKLIDVHCDEIDDEASRGLETLATRAYETGMGDMVTASHTTAMHSYNNAYVIRLMRILKLSSINFVANPCVNVHLGGRADTYPKRRSMTRVKELTDEGINVSFGSDDILTSLEPLGNARCGIRSLWACIPASMLGYERSSTPTASSPPMPPAPSTWGMTTASQRVRTPTLLFWMPRTGTTL